MADHNSDIIHQQEDGSLPRDDVDVNVPVEPGSYEVFATATAESGTVTVEVGCCDETVQASLPGGAIAEANEVQINDDGTCEILEILTGPWPT